MIGSGPAAEIVEQFLGFVEFFRLQAISRSSGWPRSHRAAGMGIPKRV